jgi:hypothetical protein
MKAKIILSLSILLIVRATSGQTTLWFSPDADVYMLTYGGGEGKNSFMKFNLASIPPNSMAISTELMVYVKEVGANWDGDVMFIRFLNQTWTEADSTQDLWNNAFWGDTLVQSQPLFGDSVGHTLSADLSALLNQDLNAGNTYFSFRMKDPDDPTSSPTMNIPLINSFDSLMLGNNNNDFVVIQPRDWGLAQYRPRLYVTYVGLPRADTIYGYGTFCENDPVTLSAAISGEGPFTFQWQKDNVDLPGETDSILTLNSVQISDAGWYRLIVTNPWSADTSGPVQCIINACTGYDMIETPYMIELFPNPTGNIIRIRSNENNYHAELISNSGQMLFRGRIHVKSMSGDFFRERIF